MGVLVTTAAYLSVYAGLLIFVASSIARIIRYAKTPVHLRWELYPIPHEEPERAAHGGSCFETSNWWMRPRRLNRIGELQAMFSEIVFLKALREFNRGLWYTSFLFHSGLYLTVATAALVLVAVVAPAGNNLQAGLSALSVVSGCAAVALTLMGAVALLVRRLTDPELKNYTSGADLFNLYFFVIVYGTIASGYLVRPKPSVDVVQFVRGLLHFDTSLNVGRGFGAGLILGSALIAYLPFTHMAHFIAKYFTYHQVRWDDRPNVRGAHIESQVASCLGCRPTWSAAHVGADGEKTWAELAAANPAAEARK